jgi:tRNA (guanosine-2'-O-)-methyltransferase
MTPERRAKLENVLAKRQPNLTVVMENVMDPHNVSAVMRSCDAVGIQDIYVISNKDPRPKKWGAKSSSSAAKWLTVHQFHNVQQCVTELRKEYNTILTTHLSSESVSLYSIDFTASIALVFGNEHEGVSEEMRSLADGNFLIPQVGIIQSLNISVACAVSIYEAFRQKSNAGHYNQSSLTEQRKSALMQQWGFLEENLKL